jgi:hypothetical protein
MSLNTGASVSPSTDNLTQSDSARWVDSAALERTLSYVVVWRDAVPNANHAIRAQLFNSSDQKVGPQLTVDPGKAGDDLQPSVAMDSSGNFVVAWTVHTNTGSIVEAQRFDNKGAPRPGVGLIQLSPVSAFQDQPDVACDTNGRFFIAATTHAGSATMIVAHRFNSDGTPDAATPSVGVDVIPWDNASQPSVTASADGSFAVAFTTAPANTPYSFVSVNQYNPSGAFLWQNAVARDYVVRSDFPSLPKFTHVAGITEVAFRRGTDCVAERLVLQFTGPATKIGTHQTYPGQVGPSIAFDQASGSYVVGYEYLSPYGTPGVQVVEVTNGNVLKAFDDPAPRSEPALGWLDASGNYLVTDTLSPSKTSANNALTVRARVGKLS